MANQEKNAAYAEYILCLATAFYLNVNIRITSETSTRHRPFFDLHPNASSGVEMLLSSSNNDHFQSLIPANETVLQARERCFEISETLHEMSVKISGLLEIPTSDQASEEAPSLQDQFAQVASDLEELRNKTEEFISFAKNNELADHLDCNMDDELNQLLTQVSSQYTMEAERNTHNATLVHIGIV